MDETSKTKKKPRGSVSDASTAPRARHDDSETRARLLDAAEQLMREDGYAAVTTRRLGAKAGLHPQLVHYYFRDMDDLFFELWRRTTSRSLARHSQAFLSSHPVRTVWEQDFNPHDASLVAELMALARHRKSLRDEIATSVERFRVMQASALSRAMEKSGLKEIFGSAEALALCMVGLARILVVESELGISIGHDDARAAIARWINHFENPADL